MNINDARQGFLAFEQFARGCTPRSIYVYDGHLRRFERFVGPRADLDRAGCRVMDYLATLGHQGLSDNTRRQVFAILRALYRWARDFDHVRENPFRGMKLPKVRKQRRTFLNRQQTYDLMASAAEGWREARDHAAMALLYYAGLRGSEAVGLRLTDLDLEINELMVFGKGGTAVRVKVSPKLRAALRAWIRVHPGGPWLFPGQRPERHIHRDTIGELIREKYAVRAGIAERICSHVLRRTGANELYRMKAPIRAVRDHLRHVHLGTTEVYLNLRPGGADQYVGKL